MSWQTIKQTLSTTATLLLLGLSLTAVYALSQGTKFLSVQSGSMVPAYSKGDLVVVNSVPKQNYKVGDVITFINPNNSQQTITHRLSSILPSDGMQPQRFVTKGDANAATDTPIYGKDVVGKVSAGIPYLGFGFDFVRQPIGLILLIYVPALTIIVAEMRRLGKHYKDQEPYVAAGFDPKQPRPSAGKRVAKLSAAGLIAAVSVAAPVAHAALMSTVTLTSSSISTAPAPNVPSYPLISKVSFGGASGSSNTTNNTTINVTNNNPQSATSGNASGPGATSGNASNSSTTNTTINIGSGGSIPTLASVTIYNPTGAVIDLSGWSLADNGTIQTIPSGTSLASNTSYTFTWPVANGLDRTNDRLALRNTTATTVDSLSWGSDVSQFNPAIITNASTTSLTRSNTSTDSNTATDWSTT